MAAGGLYDQLQRENRRSTVVLLVLGTLLVALMVWLAVAAFAGPVAFDPVTAVPLVAGGSLLGLGGMFLSMRAGPAIALKVSRAQPAPRAEYPQLHNVFDEVCASAGIAGQKPTLHIVQDPAPNAFATGLSLENSHVAVTTGLIERLPRYELRAVLAHEVGHILNNDIRTVTFAVATAGVVALLADVLVRALWVGGGGRGRARGGRDGGGGAAAIIILVVGILAVVLAPLAAQMIRFAVSRHREYLADATAADLLRDPQSMVNALRRLDEDTTQIRHFEVATAHLWFEEPNDTRGKDTAARLARRFATHPSIQQRIERLANLNAGLVRLDAPLPPPPSPLSGSPDGGDDTPDQPQQPPQPPPPFGWPGSGQRPL